MTNPFGLSPKALIRDESGRILLIRRSADSRWWPNLWELPGGKPDPGETFAQTLIREVREETGLEIEMTHLVGAAEHDLPHIRLVFLVMEARIVGGTLKLSEEHGEHRWATDEELAGLELMGPIAAAIGIG